MDAAGMYLRETFNADCLVHAIEGGMLSGWADVLVYHWIWDEGTNGADVPEAESPIQRAPHGGANAYARIREYDNGNEHDVDPKVIAAAFQKLLESQRAQTRPDDLEVSAEWRDAMLRARAEVDAGDVDAIDADQLVQIGLFGKVVYG